MSVRNGYDVMVGSAAQLLYRTLSIPADWETRIRVSEIDMRRGDLCVLGQIMASKGEHFVDAPQELQRHPAFGVWLLDCEWPYEEVQKALSGLEEAWRDFLDTSVPGDSQDEIDVQA